MNYDVNIWNYGSLSCSHIMRSVAIGCEHRNFSFSRVNIIFYVHMHSSAISLEVHVGIPCKTRCEHGTVSVNKKSCEPDRIACEHEHPVFTIMFTFNMWTRLSFTDVFTSIKHVHVSFKPLSSHASSDAGSRACSHESSYACSHAGLHFCSQEQIRHLILSKRPVCVCVFVNNKADPGVTRLHFGMG